MCGLWCGAIVDRKGRWCDLEKRVDDVGSVNSCFWGASDRNFWFCLLEASGKDFGFSCWKLLIKTLLEASDKKR